ncbi:MAG: class II fructose-bisphosphate aldolase [Nitrospinales bacterium]
MLFANKDELLSSLNGVGSISDDTFHLENEENFRNSSLDRLVYNSVLNENKEIKGLCRFIIKSVARDLGIILSSIQNLYMERGQGKNSGYTVPALNIRGMSWELSRAIFRIANQTNAGAFIFEIAQSEIGYTHQRPHELASVILAAAIKEGHRGPVFIQGDHFQVNAKKYHEDKNKEMSRLKDLVYEALKAGFYNIDIDTSTLVTLEPRTVKEQQKLNYEVGVELTQYIRENEPEGITVSVGGEIGEVGKTNSTEEELRAYMDNFNKNLADINPDYLGISKISIQTGTSHGGVPLPDGSVADVSLDFDTLAKLTVVSRESYGLAGAVQHGASTLPPDMFDRFPELETAEIHLATDFQNLIYDSEHFPNELKEEIYDYLRKEFASENKESWTDEQFIYKTRKKGFGNPFKSKFWDLPESVKNEISKELEKKILFLFEKLNVKNTKSIAQSSLTSCHVPPCLKTELEFC